MTMPMFPKPGQVKQKRKYLDDDGVFRYPNGREVCQLTSTKGREEYIRRKRVAWESQTIVVNKRTIHVCSICGQELFWKDATVDHKNPRGMGGGSRDDRQQNIGAAHGLCNQQKGSKRFDDDMNDILEAF